MLACRGRFDRGVHGEQVNFAGDVFDQVQHFRDALRPFAEQQRLAGDVGDSTPDALHRFEGFAHRHVTGVSRVGAVVGNLFNRRRAQGNLLGGVGQLLQCRGDFGDRQRLLHRTGGVIFGVGQYLGRRVRDLETGLLQFQDQAAQLAGHVVGRLGQHPQFVMALQREPARQVARGDRAQEGHQRQNGFREGVGPEHRATGGDRRQHDQQDQDGPHQIAERRERHVRSQQQRHPPDAGQVGLRFVGREPKQERRGAHIDGGAARQSLGRNLLQAAEAKRAEPRLSGFPSADEGRRAQQHAARIGQHQVPAIVLSRRVDLHALEGLDHLGPIDHFNDHPDGPGAIEARVQRRGDRHAHAVRELLHLRHADPPFAATGGLQPRPVADLAPAHPGNRRGNHLARRAGDPQFLEFEVSLGVLQELQDAPIGIGRDRVVLDQAQL